MSKIKFKKEFEDVEIHIPQKRLIINKYNIGEEYVQKILKSYPKYAHNFEVVKDDQGGESVQQSTLLTGDEGLQPEKVSPKPTAKAPSKKSGKGSKK